MANERPTQHVPHRQKQKHRFALVLGRFTAKQSVHTCLAHILPEALGESCLIRPFDPLSSAKMRRRDYRRRIARIRSSLGGNKTLSPRLFFFFLFSRCHRPLEHADSETVPQLAQVANEYNRKTPCPVRRRGHYLPPRTLWPTAMHLISPLS